MNVIIKFYVYLVAVFFSVLCEHFDLPAIEYLRRFKQPLHLGQCPNRVVQYAVGPRQELCKFPLRQGETQERRKEVETEMIRPVHDASELIRHIGLCDDRAAAYFGLLAGKDECIVNEIAGQLSFKRTAATLLYINHFRPRLDILIPSPELGNIPSEYTHYVNNSYYTINISIGTEEVIVVELQYQNKKDAESVYADTSHTSKMSQKLLSIAKKVGLPKKVKVIRLSTFDFSLSIEVFKVEHTAIFDAIDRIQKHERDIARIRHEIQHGNKSVPLRYGFKAYEIGPISYVPSFTVSEVDRKHRWEEASLLQVKAGRFYLSYKRYRKICKQTKSHSKPCRPLVELLNELKQKVLKIHDQRRDWMQLSKEQQFKFIRDETADLKQLQKKVKQLINILKSVKKTKSIKKSVT